MNFRIAFLFCLALVAWFPCQAAAEDRIVAYDSVVRLQKDGSVTVSESYTLVVEGSIRRAGPIRLFPLARTVGTKRIATPVKIDTVLRQGRFVAHQTEVYWSFTSLRVLPQTPSLTSERKRTIRNALKPGRHTFAIKWTGSNCVHALPGRSDLFVTVVGQERDIPVERATVRVVMPKGVSVREASGYIVSATGQREQLAMTARNEGFEVVSPRTLRGGETFAVGIEFTGGAIPAVPVALTDIALEAIRGISRHLIPIEGIALLMASLPALLWYLLTWLVWGRDRPLGVVTPLYSPPEDISPALASALLRVQPRVAFVASLLSLMAKRRLTLRDDGYLAVPRDAPDSPLPGEEQAILDSIGRGRMVSVDDGGRGLYATYSLFTRKCSALYSRYVNRNRKLVIIGALINMAAILLLTRDPKLTLPLLAMPAVYAPFMVSALKYMKRGRSRNLTVAFITAHCLIMDVCVLHVFGIGTGLTEIAILVVFTFLPIGMHGLFFWILDKPGTEAVSMLQKIAGLRMFIETADASRYARMRPDLYEKNLPYAVIFGFDSTWLERFSSLEGLLPWHRGGG